MKQANQRGPSKASLKEIPEIDFSKMKRLPRGMFAKRMGERMRYMPIDRELFDRLGGTAGILNILRAIAQVAPSKPARKKKAA